MPGLWEAFGAGGPIIAVLAVLSALSLTVIVVKILQLRSCRSGAAMRAAAYEQWAGGDKESARRQVAEGKSPADRVTAYAMQALMKGFKGPGSRLSWCAAAMPRWRR